MPLLTSSSAISNKYNLYKLGALNFEIMEAALQVTFELFGLVRRKGNWYVAYCPPLDLTTQGRSLGEAKQNLVEAAELFVGSCVERGTLDQALRELGISSLSAEPQPVPDGAFPMKVLIPLVQYPAPISGSRCQ